MSTTANALTVQRDGPPSSALVEHRDSLVRKYASSEHHSIALDPGPIHRLALSLDGSTLAGAAGNALCIWETRLRKLTHRFVFEKPVEHVAISRDGQCVLIADSGNALHQIDCTSGLRSELAVAPEAITAIAVDPDCTLCAYGTADGVVRTLEVASPESGLAIETRDIPTRIAVDTSSDLLLVIQAGCAEVYRLSSGNLVTTYDDNEGVLPDVDLPWAQIVTNQESVVVVFDAATGDVLSAANCASAATDFTPDGTRIVAAMNHRTIIWDGRSDEPLLNIHTYNRAVQDVKISSDGAHIYTCGYDSTVDVHTSSGQWRASLADSYGSITGAALSDSDRHLVVTDEQGFVAVYDAESGSVMRLVQHDASIAKLRLSSTWAATSSYDGTATVLDIESGETICRVGDGQVEIQAVALDGQEILITGNGLGAVRCHDIDTGKIVREYFGNDSPVRSICVSPCRRYLLTTSEHGSVLLFDYLTGELLQRLMNLGIVYEACFDADGEFFFFGDRYGTVKKVHSASGAVTDRWRALNSEIRAIGFYNDRVCAVGLFDDAVMFDPLT
ncbi:MAG: WD40 repeat domain-containing protein, partial [Gammaproteobacteria bacterium]|nr:WD40 repeat domain-containing protein [Gammaproteobacteria bacterium]